MMEIRLQFGSLKLKLSIHTKGDARLYLRVAASHVDKGGVQAIDYKCKCTPRELAESIGRHNKLQPATLDCLTDAVELLLKYSGM